MMLSTNPLELVEDIRWRRRWWHISPRWGRHMKVKVHDRPHLPPPAHPSAD
jgi:hypothetical protein